MTVHNWTDAENRMIRDMWLDGASFTQIADALATPDWTPTRNMIAGKIHRFKRNAPERPKPKPKQPVKRRRRVARRDPPEIRFIIPYAKAISMKVVRPVLPAEPPPEPAARMLPLMQLGSRDCKWPIGDVKQLGFGFCGAPREEQMPYCQYHALIAYRPIEKRKRA